MYMYNVYTCTMYIVYSVNVHGQYTLEYNWACRLCMHQDKSHHVMNVNPDIIRMIRWAWEYIVHVATGFHG